MTVQRLGPPDYARQRWRNGAGFTTELAAERDDGKVVWRVSVADVARSGPFSDFSGYERTILLLEGNGMALSFDGGAEVVLDRALEPFRFDGGWKAFCRVLAGPVRDFNLMADPARVRASLDVVHLAPGEVAPIHAAAGTTLLYAARGPADVATGAERATLAGGEMLRIDAPTIASKASGAANGCALVLIRIAPLVPAA